MLDVRPEIVPAADRRFRVYQEQEGSRNAIHEYLELLESNPGDMTSRWLLNVAYMTVGEHPEKVPAKWLIPAEKFAP